MLLKYIIERWKRLLPTYIIGVGVVFVLFFGISSLKQNYYRASFVLNPSSLEVGNAIENLFELFMLKDSATFAERMNFTFPEVARIKGAEQDVLDGGFLKIDVFTLDNQLIMPFFNNLVAYLNSDSLLNENIFFERAQLEEEMKMIREQLAQLDSNNNSAEPSMWHFMRGNSPQPVVGSSSSLNRVFLMNRLSELSIEHHLLLNVRPIIAPVVPDEPEKTSKLVYFLFSNVIVLCLMFVQFLFYSGNQEHSHK